MSNRSQTRSEDITALLKQWSRGDRDALDRVLPLVYEELRRIAARQLRNDNAAQSVDPTDLVHALYLQLVGQDRANWLNRGQFFAVVASMMRRILVDHARARLADKRGGATTTMSLTDIHRRAPAERTAGIGCAGDRPRARAAGREGSRTCTDRRDAFLRGDVDRGNGGGVGTISGDRQTNVAFGESMAVSRTAARRLMAVRASRLVATWPDSAAFSRWSR